MPARPRFEDDAVGAAEAIGRESPGAKVVVPGTPLDLTSLASCRAFGKAMVAELGTLDVLCLNAGRGGAKVGSGRIVALHYRSFTPHQIC